MKEEQLMIDMIGRYRALLSSNRPAVMVGNATCGRSAGSKEVMDKVAENLKSSGLDAELFEVGCIGVCYLEPIVAIHKPNQPVRFYGNVGLSDVEALVEGYLGKDFAPHKGLIGVLDLEGKANEDDIFSRPVMKHQRRFILQNCGLIDPSNLHHYTNNLGYKGVEKALLLGSEKVVEEIRLSGLRGRGGAGFPTWKKWTFCRSAEASVKYLVCNADEGDPGAFMNRSLIEGDPHSLIRRYDHCRICHRGNNRLHLLQS